MMRAAAVALIGSLFCLALRRYVPELALLLGVVTGASVLLVLVEAWGQVQIGMDMLLSYTGLDESLTTPVLKVTVIAVLTRLASQICRDAGEGTVAVCCELASTVGALAAAMPLLEQMMELIAGLVA